MLTLEFVKLVYENDVSSNMQAARLMNESLLLHVEGLGLQTYLQRINQYENELQFDGLIYRKTSEETMRIILKTKDADGNIAENIIDCRRSNN